MRVRSWVEMPVSAGTQANGPVRPKYAIEGDALLVYRGEKVYAAPLDRAMVDRVAEFPDVRRLAPDEAIEFEAGLPGPGAFRTGESERRGLGDLVGWFATKLHIRECGACGERRKRLNQLTARRSPRARR
jgi:hypothetical protein